MPRLDIYLKGEMLVQVRLTDKAIRLGRDEDCSVALNQPEVSRLHAEIRPVEDGFEIANFGRNGTRVNATMVDQPHRLTFGDRIYIAEYAIIFQSDDAQPAVEKGQTHESTLEVHAYRPGETG